MAAVAPVVGVISAVGGLMQGQQQAAAQASAAAASREAAEAQREINKAALEQQQAYTRYQQELSDTVYRTNTALAGMAFSEQEAQANQAMMVQQNELLRQYEANLGKIDETSYNLESRNLQLRDQENRAAEQEYRQQASGTAQIEQALTQGNQREAATLAQNAALGVGSTTSDVRAAREQEARLQALRALAEQARSGELTDQQMAYAAGLLDKSDEYNRLTLSGSRESLRRQKEMGDTALISAAAQNELAGKLSRQGLAAQGKLQESQSLVDRKFNELGYNTQSRNVDISGAAQVAQARAAEAQASAGGGLGGLLAGGANLFQSVYPLLNKPSGAPVVPSGLLSQQQSQSGLMQNTLYSGYVPGDNS